MFFKDAEKRTEAWLVEKARVVRYAQEQETKALRVQAAGDRAASRARAEALQNTPEVRKSSF
jgi:hypothetical protein